MKSNIEKNYDKFTALERINLSIAALSRNDNKEVQQLKKCCPKKTYTMNDRAYSESMDSLCKVRAAYRFLFDFYEKQIINAQVLIGFYDIRAVDYLDGLYTAFKFFDKKPPKNNPIWSEVKENEEKCDKKIAEAENKLQEYLSKLKGVQEGLRLFCIKQGFDFESVLVWANLDENGDLTKARDLSSVKTDMGEAHMVLEYFLDILCDREITVH